MNYKLFIFAFIIMLPLSLAISDEVISIKSGFNTAIPFGCSDINGNPCSQTTTCLVNVFSPLNNTLIINNLTATKANNYYSFNISGSQIITPGNYNTLVYCSDGVNSKQDSFYFKVTPTGNLNTISIAALIFGIGTLLFIFAFWKADPWTAMLGALLYMGIGVYSYLNGLGDYRDWRTDLFSITIIGVGAYIGIKAMLEVIEENL